MLNGMASCLPEDGRPFAVEHPSGVLEVDVDVDEDRDPPRVRRSAVIRTAFPRL
jgi:4-oxalomesaconate tautomerase